jgi:serine protease Do
MRYANPFGLSLSKFPIILSRSKDKLRANGSMKACLSLLLLVLFVLPCHAALERAELIGLAASVLRVEAPRASGGYSIGSAVAVAADKVITNCHVTRDAQAITVVRGSARWPASGQVVNAERDLCLLTVPGLVAPVARLGHAGSLAIGQMLSALGYTGGLGIQSSDGEVVELHRHDGAHVIQSSNWFSSGASGGGLFDESGALVGILTFRLRGGEAHYFAAPVEWVQQLIEASRGSAAQGPVQALPYWQVSADAQPRFLRAASMRRESRWSDLAALAREWLQSTADDAEPWHLLGLALARLERPAEAMAALECALHLSPSHAAVRSSLDALRAAMPNATSPAKPPRAAPCSPTKL